MITDEMRTELVEGLRHILSDKIENIILYGSVARGDSNADSDVDIAIILRRASTDEERDSFLHFSSVMDLKYDRVFSFIDIERELINEWGKVLPFYRNVEKEGIVLWKAA